MLDPVAPQLRPRPAALNVPRYVSGRSSGEIKEAYHLDQVVKLALNENPFPPSPRAVEAAAASLRDVNRYPDGAARALRDELARRFELRRSNVVVGNGSDDLIVLLALAYLGPGDVAVLADPPYSIHRKAVLLAGANLTLVPLRDQTHDLDAMAAAVTENTRLIAITSPHNPTGTAITRGALRRFVEVVPPHVAILIDEAYHEFVDDELRFTARDLLEEHPNVITLRTFSKVYGLPGLRVGYALLHEELTSLLDAIRPPFNLNSAAQAAALAALGDTEYVTSVVAWTRTGRRRLEEIARRHGFGVIPSQANFVLMQVGNSAAISEALLHEGVMVRPGETLGMPGWIRVSVGTEHELDCFESALERLQL